MTATENGPAPREGAGPGPAPRTTTRTRHAKLYMADVAALAGVSPLTIRQYKWRAGRARDAGTATPRHLPEPAGYDPPTREVTGTGHSGGDPVPWWTRRQIQAWLAARHHPGHPRADGASPAPPGSVLGRPPKPYGRKPKGTPP
jgi:hypothetical protein